MSASPFPIINTAMVSFAQMHLKIGGLSGVTPIQTVDVKTVDYSDKTNTKYFYMTSPYPVAVYSRRVEAEGSIEFGISTHRAIMNAFAEQGVGGFGDVTFDLSIIYQMTPGSPFIHDVLHGCRFKGSGQRNTVGGKHLSTTCPFLVAWIEWGGNTTAGPVLLSDAIVAGGPA